MDFLLMPTFIEWAFFCLQYVSVYSCHYQVVPDSLLVRAGQAATKGLCA
jgi:hypothetical protein